MTSSSSHPASPKAPGLFTRIRRSPTLLAGLIGAALAIWMLSGTFAGEAGGPPEEAAPVERELFAVQTRLSTASPVERVLTVQATAEAERILALRAEASGAVAELPVQRGARVSEGDVIVRLSEEDRRARLDQANAQLAQAQQDYDAASRLAERGYASESRVRTAFAALESARAGVRVAEEGVANLEIRAPFGGILDSLDVEMGEFLRVGDPIGRLVDSRQLIAEARISQTDVRNVVVGGGAHVELVTGESLEGEVRYVAANADPATRTFLVEIAIDNDDASAPSGVSAQVSIPTGLTPGHFISPAILALDTDGVLGVKTVDDDGVVHFVSVEIIRADDNGVWIAGLPEQVRLITSGQGFVSDGERVRAVDEDAQDHAAGALAGAAANAFATASNG